MEKKTNKAKLEILNFEKMGWIVRLYALIKLAEFVPFMEIQ